MKYKKRKKYQLLWIPIIISILFLDGKVLVSKNFPFFRLLQSYYIADEAKDWNLILVNADNYVPKNYKVELTTLSNGKRVDSRIYPELQAMFNEARASGLQLFVREGYRTRNEQEKLLNEKIKMYCDEGYSKSEAKKLASGWVATPGTSEHELGISVDINADTSVSSEDDVYKWLESNAHKYGFIKRYPLEKSNITGVNYEPWHYRYIGVYGATIIHDHGWCLEEYIETR